jgi:hypothetical protein
VPPDMLSELREDNVALTARLREGHEVAHELLDLTSGWDCARYSVERGVDRPTALQSAPE